MTEKIECVYIIEAAALKKIKVGYTTDLGKRLRTIQTSCPARIRLIAVIRGGRKKERELHDILARYRAYREWFNCDREVAEQFGALHDSELFTEIRMSWAEAREGVKLFEYFSGLLADEVLA